ncbi:MAG: MOSC domain-containing protein [Actinomycetota bacterium]|nr:MOSC domain-containing protein [Actinomycetota bacterium]
MPSVSRLAITPVKGLALDHPEEVFVGWTGVPENRRFFLVDERGRLLNGTRDGPLFRVRAECDAEGKRLALTFPDGLVLDDAVALGDPTLTPFWSRPVRGRLVEGPWSGALSAFLGRPVRLVRADDPGGGFDDSPVSLLSDASLAELARQAGEDRVDGRRFRMLVHLAGCAPHEEDSWIGRRLRIGAAVLRVTSHDARCRMTTRNPDTGVRDFDTLRAIKEYRGLRDGKAIDFGVYADVVRPGLVRVGDAVDPER